MKRLIKAGLMLVSAFALTNCAEELTAPVQENNDVVTDMTTDVDTSEGIPYEVIAEIAETKTAYNQTSGSTYWVPGADKINVVTSPTNQSAYTKHGEFTYVGGGKFTGQLKSSLASQNDWYYIYGSSSVATGTDKINAQVTIGAAKDANGDYIQTQQGDPNLAGEYYPMYGIKRNIPNTQTPKVAMSHLYSIIALSILNEGDKDQSNTNEDIKIQTIEFVAPEAIVGKFDVNILGDFYLNAIEETYVPVTGMSSNVAKINVKEKNETDTWTDYINIPSGSSKIVYLAVKPFDASNKELTIKINGTEKKVKMPANVKFDAGKKVTVRVPVKLSHPKESDAMSFIKSIDGTTKTVYMNGEKISAYVLHHTKKSSRYTPHTLTVKGNVKDLLNALGAGFYVSTWDGMSAAMTVSNINVWINDTQFIKYEPLLTALKTNFASQPGLGELVAMAWDTPLVGVKALLGYFFQDGVGRDGEISLTKFIAPETITFTGIVSNGASEDDEMPSIFFLDDGTLHKLVSTDKVNELLQTKFDFITESGETILPSYQGLMDIVNKAKTATPSPEATRTATAIYRKLHQELGDVDKEFAGLKIKVWDIFAALFPDVDAFIELLPSMTVSVTIQNYPYTNVAGGYGKKGNPIKPDPGKAGDASDDLNPIIFWGFDMNCD
jgi:hypothetical protein